MTLALDADLVFRNAFVDALRPKVRRWATPGAMAAELEPRNHRTTPALDRIDRELADWADGHSSPKLMVFCPPQEGKSQKVSRRTPAWLLSHDPTLRIAIVSFEQERAVRWGRDIKRDVETHPKLGIQLRPDSRAAGRWHTVQGGGVYAVGLGGALAGEPVDILIIDDPVKGRREAESPAYRQYAWDWWESVGATRMSSRGRVCLMTTRWHEDDLAGRLLAKEPGEWNVLRIPAIAEENDPIGRKLGEELVSVQNRPPGYFRNLQKVRSPYVWLSIYQQTPTAAEGLIFKRIWWRYWRLAPQSGMTSRRLDLGGRIVLLGDCWRVATMDLANSTRTSADWTVCSAWAITSDGDIVLLDRARARIGEAGHFDLARPLVEEWALDTVFVEESQFGTTLVREATRSGVMVSPVRADADKLTRALPASDKAKAGRIWLPATAPWLDVWRNEHAEFPSSTHDDQCDTLAYAVRVAVTKPMPQPHRPVQREHEVDFESVPL